MNKDDAEGRGFEPATAGDCHIIPLTDVIDVDRDAGISPNAVFLHQRDKLRFCQVVGRAGVLLYHLHLLTNNIANHYILHIFVVNRYNHTFCSLTHYSYISGCSIET